MAVCALVPLLSHIHAVRPRCCPTFVRLPPCCCPTFVRPPSCPTFVRSPSCPTFGRSSTYAWQDGGVTRRDLLKQLCSRVDAARAAVVRTPGDVVGQGRSRRTQIRHGDASSHRSEQARSGGRGVEARARAHQRREHWCHSLGCGDESSVGRHAPGCAVRVAFRHDPDECLDRSGRGVGVAAWDPLRPAVWGRQWRRRGGRAQGEAQEPRPRFDDVDRSSVLRDPCRAHRASAQHAAVDLERWWGEVGKVNDARRAERGRERDRDRLGTTPLSHTRRVSVWWD